ncbi:hypothetical protein AAX26_02017 [Aliarcobacter thereius]|uniref:Uncharacterized protein n=2 Tax=Aliarcobacter thereius TaxID=544718 RepID=A0A1C0B5W8_9BACT|nr:hypothetical protein [Aliarcobacter thereius]OCL85345.1 hypothetical protein AAX26_02017 [Aliarcobacter thereius]OCL90386.1 hypothetical protein AAX25_01476 [Aliarcobacter thereius]OCL95859.1 hypothetical protein AA347_01342 [Aliarcobacter thereius LMG 24486]OCL98428.1 hypothetical protein AAX29_01668 [Aliarcobacter thereius]QBF16168.1 hypothetical protein ATH_1109 [Aliarcobacter thereius LMG 24486]
MRIFLILTIFLSNFLLANYNYTGQNSGKIDMHGKKNNSFIEGSNSFGNKNLNNIGIAKPKNPEEPKKPNSLIDEKKDNKK